MTRPSDSTSSLGPYARKEAGGEMGAAGPVHTPARLKATPRLMAGIGFVLLVMAMVAWRLYGG